MLGANKAHPTRFDHIVFEVEIEAKVEIKAEVEIKAKEETQPQPQS